MADNDCPPPTPMLKDEDDFGTTQPEDASLFPNKTDCQCGDQCYSEATFDHLRPPQTLRKVPTPKHRRYAGTRYHLETYAAFCRESWEVGPIGSQPARDYFRNRVMKFREKCMEIEEWLDGLVGEE